jgi:hypothetical protein
VLIGLFTHKKDERPVAQGYGTTREGDTLIVPFFVLECLVPNRKKTLWCVTVAPDNTRHILKVKNPRLHVGAFQGVELEIL